MGRKLYYSYHTPNILITPF